MLEHEVLVVGAGEMAEGMIVALAAAGPDHVYVEIKLKRRWLFQLATTYFPALCLFIISEILLLLALIVSPLLMIVIQQRNLTVFLLLESRDLPLAAIFGLLERLQETI